MVKDSLLISDQPGAQGHVETRMNAKIRVREGLLSYVQALCAVNTDPQIQIEAAEWELRLEAELEELRRKKKSGVLDGGG
jgi:hypothetical protein